MSPHCLAHNFPCFKHYVLWCCNLQNDALVSYSFKPSLERLDVQPSFHNSLNPAFTTLNMIFGTQKPLTLYWIYIDTSIISQHVLGFFAINFFFWPSLDCLHTTLLPTKSFSLSLSLSYFVLGCCIKCSSTRVSNFI